MVDISRARRAEAELQDREHTYRQLVENATDILFRTDVFGRFTFVNSTAVARSGYERDELVGKSYLELIRPDHRQHVRQVLERQYRDRDPNAYVEFVAVAKDGTEAWIGQNTQLLEERGRVTGFQAISRDVTERRRAEEALAESERRYRLLADNALDLIGLYSPAGDMLYASPSHERVLGWSAEEMTTRALFDLVDERDEPAVREAIRAVLGSHVPSHLDIRMPTRDGSIVLLDTLVSAVRDDNGPRALIVARDITARRETESRLAGERATVSRLQILDEVRKTFVLALAHDLRAPVTAIQGSAATLLRTDLGLDDEQEHALLRAVLSNARRLERMLTDLLDLERLDRGQIGADRRKVDVAERLDAIVTDWIEAGGRAIDVSVEVSEAWIDAVMLDRIMLNLLSNAARHAPLGDYIGVRARWAPTEPDALLVTVEDSGPGVPPDMKEAVFERFRRGPGSESEPGVGIGLWLVASFARLHRGEAWIDDRVGGGAAFNVILRDARSEPAR
jgi:PAS domain S-box-containing protein